MRDRLIELLKKADEHAKERCITDYVEAIADNADYLLANGVIVPPCKVGARVCVITSKTSDNRNLYIFEDTITHYRIVDGCTIMCFENHLGEPNWNWDKVFVGENAREEAEKAMKGGAE